MKVPRGYMAMANHSLWHTKASFVRRHQQEVAGLAEARLAR